MDDIDSDVSSSEEEPLTADRVLQTLEEAWLNEKFCPEMMPHQTDLVDCMLEQITHMEENVNKLQRNDFRVVVHQMELDRIRYVITSYLRTRLAKIEAFTVSILEQEASRDERDKYLSPGELRFATEYLAHMESHFALLAFRHMPGNFQEFDKSKMLVTPNLASHIFLRANKSINGVVVDDEEVDLEENSQHMLQYVFVSDLVKNGSVQLI